MAYGGTPETLTRDGVRVLVGDVSTSTGAEFLSNEAYDFFLASAPNTFLAAKLAATALAAKFAGAAADANGSGFIEKSVGDLKIKKADAIQTASEFRSLASYYGRLAAAGVSPYAGGISNSDVSSVEGNADRVRPAFVQRLFDNPGAGTFGASEST